MAPFSMPKFLSGQLFTRLHIEKRDLSGQTIIVTGANIGLGKETARHLADMKPARLILAVRNTQKGQDAADDIKATSGCLNVEVWELDLGNFSSVKAFAKRVNSDLQRLDVLIENAGIATDKWEQTSDGYESTLQVNVIATTMLALLCMPKLRETVRNFRKEVRLVLVGSEVHFWAQFVEQDAAKPIAELNKKEIFAPQDRYFVSKLLDMLVTREFGERLNSSAHPEDKSILVNCPNPGLCHSSLSRNDAGYSLYIMKLLLARSTEYGARNFVFAALADQTNQGEYVTDCSFAEPSDYVISPKGKQTQKTVWSELQEILRKEAPDTAQIFS